MNQSDNLNLVVHTDKIEPITDEAQLAPGLTTNPPMLAAAGSNLERVTNALLKDVAPATRRIYLTDAMQFANFLQAHNFNVQTVEYEGLLDYRAHLEATYPKATAARKLVVARRLLDVAVILKLRQDNPARQVKGFKGAGNQETTHRALTKAEARQLLEAVDLTTRKGKRDYALLTLLLRTGIRRAEASGLTLGDIRSEQGHTTAVIQHGKGDKRRMVKLQPDVRRIIFDYLRATERDGLIQTEPTAPLFVVFKGGKGDQPAKRGMSGLDIERVVIHYAQQCELEGLTPHGLRASFVTLTLEAGAKLQQVQYAAGHADPRTTERYQKRKLNLDDNATDYLKI